LPVGAGVADGAEVTVTVPVFVDVLPPVPVTVSETV